MATELAPIYVSRGVSQDLANQVATQLMAHDALAAHARDELGISETIIARPVQATVASGTSFAAGAILPLASVLMLPNRWILFGTVLVSLASLALLGAIGALAGSANAAKGAARVTFWGAFAMAITAAVGAFFDVTS